MPVAFTLSAAHVPREILLNGSYGGFRFSDEFIRFLAENGIDLEDRPEDYSEDYDLRNFPVLISLAKEFGLDRISAAPLSKIYIDTVPANFRATISNYDGLESLHLVREPELVDHVRAFGTGIDLTSLDTSAIAERLAQISDAISHLAELQARHTEALADASEREEKAWEEERKEWAEMAEREKQAELEARDQERDTYISALHELETKALRRSNRRRHKKGSPKA